MDEKKEYQAPPPKEKQMYEPPEQSGAGQIFDSIFLLIIIYLVLLTPLALGLMGFVVAHHAGIKSKGFKAYAREYFQPMFFMMPLNLIGEMAKIVSISFRLFGNIMGGSIIILVVSHLTYSLVLPPLLNAFFGLFVGTIQAFVFTMLTVVYISVQIK